MTNTAEIIAADRIQWRKLDTGTIRQVRTEAAAAGDSKLVRRADHALSRRQAR